MSYSIETYDKAQNILDRRKEKATLEAQSRIDKLCAEIPELNVINRKLAQIGLNISRTFFTILSWYFRYQFGKCSSNKLCSSTTTFNNSGADAISFALAILSDLTFTVPQQVARTLSLHEMSMQKLFCPIIHSPSVNFFSITLSF